MKPVSRSAASTVSRCGSSTGGTAGLALISNTMPNRSPACEPWSMSFVLSCWPAGRIDEFTTVRSFSAELASTNSCDSDTVPVTAPPACPMIFETPATSSSRASGVRNTTTDLPPSASCTIRPPSCVSKLFAALSFSLSTFFWSLSPLICVYRSRFSSRRLDSRVSDKKPEPSTTPTANARKTAASENACWRNEIMSAPSSNELADEVLYPEGEAVPVFDDPVQDHAVGAGHPQGDDDGDQHRQRQQRDGARRDVVAVQGGDCLGVYHLL